MGCTQLALDLWPVQDDDDDFVPVYRHDPVDLDDHQHGFFRAPYDFASGTPAGTVLPAWVCCKCGGMEPTQFTLGINHCCWSPYSKCPPPGNSKFELLPDRP